MTAFLKIDRCHRCEKSLPWEWVPAVLLHGKPLAGTGVWRSTLTHGYCPECLLRIEKEHQKAREALARRSALIQLLGVKPYREFTFEGYRTAPGNRRGFERARSFNPGIDNLYLWGPSGVGKTHLAYAIARNAFVETLSVEILTPTQLVRKARMKDPDVEQALIDRLAGIEVLVIDALGTGKDSLYGRDLLQEIFDRRDRQDRAGLVVTSSHGLDALAEKYLDDALSSRLAGLCRVVEIAGPDGRITGQNAVRFQTDSAVHKASPTARWE